MSRFTVVIVLVLLLLSSHASARTITDMLGRKVTVPNKIEKVVALSPPATYLVYMMDSSLLAGLNCPLRENELMLTTEHFRKLPVIGGMVGEGRTLNMELLLKIKPDVAFLWIRRNGEIEAVNRQYMQALAKLRIPTVAVYLEKIEEYPAAIQFMGEVLGRKERAAKLRRYASGVIRNVQRKLAGLPENKRVSVYYAEGVDGLSTEGVGSMHSELIPLSGGRNVCSLKPSSLMGEEKITMEQLLLYDPDVILVKERICFERIRNDSRWRRLRAVHNKRVYLIPYAPFNWFDRPPSHMRLLGVQWLTNLLYPDRYPIDMVKEARNFYHLFIGRDLSDREARDVLWPR